MDCRNFINEVCQCDPGMELEKMFQLHTSLLEKYLPIEGLPHWPINVNKREAQIILKDMSARVIEELGEGYESTTYVLEMLDKLGYNFNNNKKWEREDYRQLLNHLQNSNEEQADAIAFFMNLLFYSNIYVEDIKSYVIAKGLNKLVDSTISREDMSTDFLMMVGLGILQNRFEDALIDNQHTWPIFTKANFERFNIKDYDKVASYTPAFHSISWEFHDVEAKMCWELSYHLSVARNYLKNKPWKQTGEMTDEKRFQEELVIAFLELLGYFRYIGFTGDSLLQLRYKKHLVCEFRIRTKY